MLLLSNYCLNCGKKKDFEKKFQFLLTMLYANIFLLVLQKLATQL